MRYKNGLLMLLIVTMTSYKGIAQEICNNGIDDDRDGLIDLVDPDCQCHYTVAGNLLLNGSFEENEHCPLTYTYDSEKNIALHWTFASYTNINEANFYHNLNCPNDTAQIAHMQPALPLPQGTGFVAIYNSASLHPIPENEMTKGYISQCLQSPLKSGADYTLSFFAGRFRSWDNFTGKTFPFNVAVYGNADCNAVPFGKKYVSGNGCPANYAGWMLLGTITVRDIGEWVQSKVHLNIPTDINVIAIGPDCSILPPINDLTDSTTYLDYHLYYLDDLHLLPTKDFPLEYIHVKTGGNCTSLPLLEAPVTANAAYQWYRDSIAIKDATNAAYQVTDTPTHYYNVLVTANAKCNITEPLLVTRSQLDKISIPADTALCAGDVLQLAPVLDGIRYTVNGTGSNNVAIDKEGHYTIIATNINGCEKMFNTIVARLNCTDCDAYVPNAFTPNGDGLNDVFKAKIPCLATHFYCRIFDRWGKQVFESSNIHQGWNGVYINRKMSQGLYVYIIQYKTASGTDKLLKGVVMLMQ